MKIKITETYIEADARELRESNTLAGNFAALLSRCFQSHEPFDDEEEEQEEPKSPENPEKNEEIEGKTDDSKSN